MINLDLISKIIAIMLGILNIFQILILRNEKSSVRSVIRSWQNQVEGIRNGLLNLSTNPMANQNKDILYGGVLTLWQQAASLNNAMLEERFYSEKESKLKREKVEKEMKELIQKTNTQSSSH